MKQKKNNETNEIEKFTFEEEVPDEDLHSKLGVDDHIYVEGTISKIKNIILILLAIFLILTSLFSLLFGFRTLDRDFKARRAATNVSQYNLLVVHSNGRYGGKIDSFSTHNSLEKAYSYNFSVSNKNPVDLKYSIQLNNLNFGNDNVDMKLINYQLYKNNSIVSEGNLENLKDYNLYDADIVSGTSDSYVIKVWSEKIKNSGFEFRINVGV